MLAMQVCRKFARLILTPRNVLNSVPAAGVQAFPPPEFKDIEIPETRRLRVILKVPQYPNVVRPFKMQKKLRLMRGPEEFHNTLLYKQFGIVATGGGRMKHNNFELVRMSILKRVKYDKAFAIWRIPAPWQPVTKKASGLRMGGGKGGIHEYVTPVRAGQVIMELGGHIEYFEVKRVLTDLARRMPFDAIPVSQEIMDKMAEDKRRIKEENQNPWNWKYIIQNNMLGCHKWISKYDRRWFNEYL